MTNFFSPEQRRTIALGWPVSDLTQANYAHLHGISTRTLRSWLRKHEATDQLTPENLRKIISRAISDLEVLRARIDRAFEAAGRGEDPLARPSALPRRGEQGLTLAPNALPGGKPSGSSCDDDSEGDTGPQATFSWDFDVT